MAAVIALQNFHGLVDRLQPRGAATPVRVVLADQLPVAQLDQRVINGAVLQLEKRQRGGLFLVALHPRPEAFQQLLHVALSGFLQVLLVEIVGAQGVLLAERLRAAHIRRETNLQRADLQVRGALFP